jgi:hypothetical protein
MTLSRILSIVFLISALALGYFLYRSVDDVMQKEKLIIATEARIIEKLQMLRDAQTAYLATNGVYAGNWNELKRFIQDGKIWLVQRTESTKLLEYGKEEITVKYDTLGSVNVIDSLFNERKYPNFNIDNMHVVPGSGGKQFEFFADKVERTQRQIPVFEIRDPDPINPKRRLNNKERALRVGSRTDSSTSGNWE